MHVVATQATATRYRTHTRLMSFVGYTLTIHAMLFSDVQLNK